jgi:hypothetical protein
MSDFDWIDNPDIVLSTQMAVAVFENARGEVCLRQQAEPWQDEDQWVTFTKDRALDVARRILEVAGIDLDAQAHALPALKKDTTAAERQRRRRARNNVTPFSPVTVTPSHAVTPVTEAPPLMAAE